MTFDRAPYRSAAAAALLLLVAASCTTADAPQPAATTAQAPEVRDRWFQRLLADRASAASASPAASITGPIPPTLLLVGGEDLVTPPAGARAFCAAARRP